MTNDEAIYCMESYLKDRATSCNDCKYYGLNTCKSNEAHKMAANALTQNQKKGEWIYNPEDYAYGNPTGSYECSRCGESVPDKTNFCPECGSDNRGSAK